MKVVFQYDAGPALRQRLAALTREGLSVFHCREDDDARFAEMMGDAEVLWHVLKPVTADVIERASRLRLIQKIGVGLNTIDLETARAKGIKVCNMPGTNNRAVAEMTLLLILATLRRLPTFDQACRSGAGWARSPEPQDDLCELGGRCVGLVGYGAVPRVLAPMLNAMGADVLYTTRERKADAVARWRDLPRLLAESDVVSLHLPLTQETERIIDEQALGRMKRGAVLVNTARGGLVDEDALVVALRSGRLRGAGLDVYAHEPIEHDNPLLRLENVVLTPHVAWLTTETIDRSLAVAVENCRRLGEGEPLVHQVV